MSNVPPEPRPLEPDDEELLLYHWGESPHAEDIRRRLDASPELAARYAELCRLLDAVSELEVPVPEAGYGAQVWTRIRPRLGVRRRRPFLAAWLERLAVPSPRLAMAGALAALLAVAFLAGRWSVPVSTPEAFAAEDRERMLELVVADHLERSERLLVELANASPAAGGLAADRDGADELLGDNRFYRQASRRSGQGRIELVLDELERLLLDLAHTPAGLAPDDLDALRERLEDVLFKIQVLSRQLRSRQLRRDTALTL